MRYSFIAYILRFLTRGVLARYKPTIIGITGSVGKTSTKEAIFAVLNRTFFVAKSGANLNNEIGVPCTILGIIPAGTRDERATWRSRGRFARGIVGALWLVLGPKRANFPKIFILELGADKPGDMAYLSELVRPQVAVVTAVGTVPAHVGMYENANAVAAEKGHILDFIGPGGVAILGADDPITLMMKSRVHGPVVTFGMSPAADVRASDLAFYMDENRIAGLSFKVNRGSPASPDERASRGGSFVPIRVPGIIAPHHVQAILAAVAVGLHFGMNLVEITGALEQFEAPPHRVQPIAGIRGSMLIDDTYNASPLSAKAALETLSELAAALKKRRIAVLGDMKELGPYAKAAHEELGQFAAGKADVVITVGDLAKFITSTKSFDTNAAAIEHLKGLITPDDVILVKGSHDMKMFEIIDALKT